MRDHKRYVYTTYTLETMPKDIKCLSCNDSIKGGCKEMLNWSFKIGESGEEVGCCETCFECYMSKHRLIEDIELDITSEEFLKKLKTYTCPTCEQLYVDVWGSKGCSLC